MPIYEFQCTKCGAHTEHLMRLSDPDPTQCPSCHAAALTRVLTAPSFRLAGAGWYETDFKGDKDRKRNLAGEGGESRPADKPDAAAPAKTETAAPAKADSAAAKPAGDAPPKPPSPAVSS
jgi:putative FmdB family regulatory protein